MSDEVFHADEKAAQRRAGFDVQNAPIRDFLTAQHRDFYPLLPYIFASVADEEGWPLATMLTGAAGFVQAPDAITLRIDALPGADDPAAPYFHDEAAIGLLGIDFSTRRRNRANGRIAALDRTGMAIAVAQSFGNCPQYIQVRQAEPAKAHAANAEEETAETASPIPPAASFAGLPPHARGLIERADTFLVASRSRHLEGATAGLDISHRGGKPGFVKVAGDRLTIPDFRGNRFFNTLGNLLGEPRAGLLFVDFEQGDLLQLQGRVEIDWAAGPDESVLGAERLWHFEPLRGWCRRGALPLRWTFGEFSPHLARTGVWAR